MMTPVRSAVGIEIVPSRHDIAQVAQKDATKAGILTATDEARLRFILGDALDSSQYASNATHLYAANLCFDEGMNKKLVEGLRAMGPQFRCIMVLRPLSVTWRCIKMMGTQPVRMSWSHSSVYYYCNTCT